MTFVQRIRLYAGCCVRTYYTPRHKTGIRKTRGIRRKIIIIIFRRRFRRRWDGRLRTPPNIHDLGPKRNPIRLVDVDVRRYSTCSRDRAVARQRF